MHARPWRGLVTKGHFKPVQFLFHQMKRVVANLIAFAHIEYGLASRLKRCPAQFGVRRLSGITSFRTVRCKTYLQFFAHRSCNRSLFVPEACQTGAESALTRGRQLTPDGIVIS